jgi:chitinase
MYAEIQDIIAGGASPTLDKDAAVKQLVWDTNQWISYDDADTFKLKIDYANKICLGGLMVWAASTDDRNWTAAESCELERYNLSSNSSHWANKVFVLRVNPKVLTACHWDSNDRYWRRSAEEVTLGWWKAQNRSLELRVGRLCEKANV